MAVRIGVEEEFHIVEVESGVLVPRAGTVLEELSDEAFTSELKQSVVESNSAVHASLDDLHADLTGSRRRLDAAAADHGLAVVAAGTVPLSLPSASVPPTPGVRYRHMVDEYRAIADEQLICGAQVHVDVPDRDTAVRVMCEVAPWLAVLLALSASSPFWQGVDTGYASWRTMLWQRWPTAGPAGCFADAAEYDVAVSELIGSGVISDPGMIYYDVRPSAHQQTLELRICDACPRVETVVLITALFRALVTRAGQELAARRGAPACQGRHGWLRAASWRAARSGLEEGLIDPDTHREAPAPQVVGALLQRVRPQLEAVGDWGTVVALTERALAEGSAAHRMRSIADREDLLACVDLAVGETRGRRGAAPPADPWRPTRPASPAAGDVPGPDVARVAGS
ncbi:carboxylate-amine ligase [Streptomyces fructofermentans]|uniref:Putative glutamate--cysteine ligase 2 n=1 Tax=Streptomyces fructofermentans TaxID=152141 RepID=A0A918NMG2_9ACTN|nr:glutamate--cysteine ligase [Streptomyces fructofermentans]GGX81022.1 putative glutamate--cysteine ligase 2-2 [Streptomyces fructofermentans]